MDTTDATTKRLRLVTITPPMLEAEAAGDSARLAQLLGAEIPSLWPPEHWEPHVFGFIARQYAEQPETAGWNRYLILREPPATLIGTAGAHRREDSEAEIGYSVLPPWQRVGLATEAVTALLEILQKDAGVRGVIAHTFPSLFPSVRVLEKCGFRSTGPAPGPATGPEAEERAVQYRLGRPTTDGTD